MAVKDKLISNEALKPVYDNLNGKVSDLKSAIGNTTGNAIVPMTNGAYIAIGDSTISIDSPTSNADYRYGKVSCSAGDVFTINATATSGAKPYGFCAADGTTIERAYMASNQTLTLTDFVVRAPSGAAYLVINDNSGAISFYGDAVTLRTDRVAEIANSVANNVHIPLDSFYFTKGSLTGAGKYTTNSYRIASRNYVDIQGYSAIYYDVDDGYRVYVAFYTDTKESAYDSNAGWNTGSGTLTTSGKYMRLVIDTTGGTTVLDPSAASNVRITGNYTLKGLMDAPRYEYNATLSTQTDLNDLYANGWYLLSNAGEYPHTPDGNPGQRIVFVSAVNNNPTASSFRHMFYANKSTGVYAHRVYANSSWTNWVFINDYGNISELFTPTAQASQGANTGYNLRFMTYNIAEYDNDTSTHISDAQLFSLRRMLGAANADIITIQEDQEHIDSADQLTSQKYVFLPQYPYKRGANGGVIHSKTSPIDSAAEGAGINLVHSNGRYIRFATYQLTDNIKLLVMCAHPVYNYNETGGTSADSIAARLMQYTEMFQWANGDISLNDKDTGNAITVPAHTHTIIGIDANSATTTDKTNLTSLANTYNYRMANGGALGWFLTEFKYNYSIDNVIVSDNIIINNAETYNNWFSRLYSDHVPLVADLTLL